MSAKQDREAIALLAELLLDEARRRSKGSAVDGNVVRLDGPPGVRVP